MRRWLSSILVALLLMALVIPAGILLLGGISARPEPSALEVAIARRLRSLAIPGSARRAANPLGSSPGAVAEGLAHFADHCAGCHGNDGSGDTPLGRGLYPRAPDMRGASTQALTDGELFYIIENGVRLTGMPAWGAAGRPEESWKLVRFVRHLPRLTPEELAEMDRHNPRGPAEWKELQEDERFLRAAPPPRPAGDRGAR